MKAKSIYSLCVFDDLLVPNLMTRSVPLKMLNVNFQIDLWNFLEVVE